MKFVIKLNSSEALCFFGLFGVFVSFPNFNQIILNHIFPIIIEETNNILFKILYFLLLIGLTYESFNWIYQLAENMVKTRNLNVDYYFYLFKVFLSGMVGVMLALFLNKILFN